MFHARDFTEDEGTCRCHESRLLASPTLLALAVSAAPVLAQTPAGANFDLAIANGRVVDPETGLDAV